jgi:hypothetical protein
VLLPDLSRPSMTMKDPLGAMVRLLDVEIQDTFQPCRDSEITVPAVDQTRSLELGEATIVSTLPMPLGTRVRGQRTCRPAELSLLAIVR